MSKPTFTTGTFFNKRGEKAKKSCFPKHAGWRQWTINSIGALNTPSDAPHLLRSFAEKQLKESALYFSSQ
jgi:hypothetical protein